jgi:uncharacterized protein YecE (DUF72 family)
MPVSDSVIFCGPSGWSFASELANGRKQHPLEYVAEHFDTVEIHDSFSAAVKPEVSRVWLKKIAANKNFQFTAKLHRRFTHDRILDAEEINRYKDGLWPFLRAGRFGCLLMQFPWSFRYTKENREFFLRLRRTFREFALAAEMRHASWMSDEAVGTFIDYRVAFCNIDQPSYTKAMPPTAFLTSPVGYVRLHGRNSFNWYGENNSSHRYDYLYSDAELADWKNRIDRISGFASKVFVITNNDAGAKAMVNGLQLRSMLKGSDGRDLPPEMLRRCPSTSQGVLFSQYPGQAVA